MTDDQENGQEIKLGPIRRHPDVCHGALTFAGHRVYVDQLFGWLGSESALAEFRADFPGVSLAQARHTLDLAARLLQVLTAHLAVERWKDEERGALREAMRQEMHPEEGQAPDDALASLLVALQVPGWHDPSHLRVDLTTWSDALQRHIPVPASTLWVLANLAYVVDSTVPIEHVGDELAGWTYRAERVAADIVGAGSWDDTVRALHIPERSRRSLVAHLQELPRDEVPARLARLREPKRRASDERSITPGDQKRERARPTLSERLPKLSSEHPEAVHDCPQRRSHRSTVAWEEKDHELYGPAITEVTRWSGRWWAHNEEYATEVSHCPWCGEELSR